MPESIDALPEFFSHALAIEREAVQRYREFEAYFTGRGDEVLAGLCGNLARLESDHVALLERATTGMELPVAVAGDHGWLTVERTEDEQRAMYRVIGSRQLLEIALSSECNAVGFFEWVASTTADEQVRKLAQDMALEEMEHVNWVRDAIEYLERGAKDVGEAH